MSNPCDDCIHNVRWTAFPETRFEPAEQDERCEKYMTEYRSEACEFYEMRYED